MNKLISLGDKTAIALSVICIVHCTVLPVLLILLPPVSAFLSFNDELFHLWLLAAVIPISLLAIMTGYVHHKNGHVIMIGLLGLTLLILAVVFGHDILGGYGEVVLTIAGSVVIAYSHYQNFRQRRLAHNN